MPSIKQGYFLKPLIELIVAASLWGFAFVATVWVLGPLDAPAIIFYRFLISTLVGLIPVFILRKSWGINRALIWSELKLSFWPGVWLFATLILQTFGLLTTTASKSAFITVLYVVLVPIITAIQGTDRFLVKHFVCVVLALIGLGLFQELKMDSWSFGDSLTLIAAVAASFHILTIGTAAPRSRNKYLLNLGQGFFTTIFALFFFPLGSRADLTQLDFQGWFGLLILSIGAGLIAFFLQVKAQEKIPPNLASLLFLLESPFSALFAFWLLNERFSGHQLAGGALILVACAWAIKSETPKQSSSTSLQSSGN